jgi:hypothetical protein
MHSNGHVRFGGRAGETGREQSRYCAPARPYFHHRLVRGRTPKSAHLTFLARWPSRKAVQHARDRIREITGRERLLVPAGWIVEDLNRFLRGWAGYCVSRGHARWDRRAVGSMI